MMITVAADEIAVRLGWEFRMVFGLTASKLFSLLFVLFVSFFESFHHLLLSQFTCFFRSFSNISLLLLVEREYCRRSLSSLSSHQQKIERRLAGGRHLISRPGSCNLMSRCGWVRRMDGASITRWKRGSLTPMRGMADIKSGSETVSIATT